MLSRTHPPIACDGVKGHLRAAFETNQGPVATQVTANTPSDSPVTATANPRGVGVVTASTQAIVGGRNSTDHFRERNTIGSGFPIVGFSKVSPLQPIVRSFWKRLFSPLPNVTDNTNVNVVALGDKCAALTESRISGPSTCHSAGLPRLVFSCGVTGGG
jgi:hypothetical protein